MIQKWTYRKHQQWSDEPQNTFFLLKKVLEDFMYVIRKLRKCKINKASSFDGILNGLKGSLMVLFQYIYAYIFKDLGNITYLKVVYLILCLSFLSTTQIYLTFIYTWLHFLNLNIWYSLIFDRTIKH